MPSGESKEIELKSGMTMITPPVASHSFENIGNQALKIFIVELKSKERLKHDPSQKIAQDPVEVSPEVYKVLKENDQVRVLLATYGVGVRDKWHSHPELVVYGLTGAKGRMYMASGEPKDLEIKLGTCMIPPPFASYSIENIGEGIMKFLLVELK